MNFDVKELKIGLLLLMFLINCARKEERIRNARRFIDQWNYDRALTEIIAFRKDKNAEIQYLLGLCYLKKNEFEEAAKYFGNSLLIQDIYKDSIINYYNVTAQNALKINEAERALFLYEEIAKLVPSYNQASNLFITGDLNFEKGNYLSAAKAYRRALEIDSTSPEAKEAKYQLIRALAASDSLESALRLAEVEYEKLKTAANLLRLSEIRFALGKKFFDAAKLDSAEVYFNQIIVNQEPKSLLDDAYFYLGEIYLKKNNLDKAISLYKKVLRLDPYQKGEMTKKAKERIKEIKEKT